MKTSCKELKRIARENLTGHYKTPMGAFLVAGLITFAIELPFSMLLQNEYASTFQSVIYYLVEFLISLLNVVLLAGVADIHLKMARHQEYRISQVFGPLKLRPDRYLIAGFLTMLLVFASVIPVGVGIANAILDPTVQSVMLAIALGAVSTVLVAYFELKISFVYYILLDDENISPWQAIKKSFYLMKGNMGRLLYLQFSFIGMNLLGLVSLGIGMLWVVPYQTQTMTQFYLDVCENVPQDTFR